MKSLILLAGSALLLSAVPTLAQDEGSVTPGDLPPSPADTTPTDPAPAVPAPLPADQVAAPAAAAYTDAQVEGFAQAMTAINALPNDDPAAKQQQAVAILAEAGIDVATYNGIGQALPTNDALAERVRVALAANQTSSGA